MLNTKCLAQLRLLDSTLGTFEGFIEFSGSHRQVTAQEGVNTTSGSE